jgi:hypothetical protein
MPSTKAQPTAVKRIPKSTPVKDAGESPSVLIDRRIKELHDWRGEILSRLRSVITGADPEVEEEWKWNIPVWSCNGIICTGETYKMAVKVTFAKGAVLADPSKLFNSSLEGKVRRAIDFPEGTVIDEVALRALVQAAINYNRVTFAGKSKGAA